MRNKKYIIPEISAQSIIASARQTGDGYNFYFDITDPSKEYLVERTLQDDCPIFYQAMLVLEKKPDSAVLSDALSDVFVYIDFSGAPSAFPGVPVIVMVLSDIPAAINLCISPSSLSASSDTSPFRQWRTG